MLRVHFSGQYLQISSIFTHKFRNNSEVSIFTQNLSVFAHNLSIFTHEFRTKSSNFAPTNKLNVYSMKKKWLSELEHGEMFNLLGSNLYVHNIYYAGGKKDDITKHGCRAIKDITDKKFYFCRNIEVYSYELIIKDV